MYFIDPMYYNIKYNIRNVDICNKKKKIEFNVLKTYIIIESRNIVV